MRRVSVQRTTIPKCLKNKTKPGKLLHCSLFLGSQKYKKKSFGGILDILVTNFIYLGYINYCLLLTLKAFALIPLLLILF